MSEHCFKELDKGLITVADEDDVGRSEVYSGEYMWFYRLLKYAARVKQPNVSTREGIFLYGISKGVRGFNYQVSYFFENLDSSSTA